MKGRDQIPNLLTLSRLILGLVFPWLPAEIWLPALLWGTLSEFLDGFLARRMNVVSAFGQLMDPVVDKIFVMAAALTFLKTGSITLSQLLFMTSRDNFVTLSSLMLVLLGRSHQCARGCGLCEAIFAAQQALSEFLQRQLQIPLLRFICSA